MKTIILFITIIMSFVRVAAGELVVIKNTEGVERSVELMSYRDEKVKFKLLGNTKVYEVPISSLAAESQDFVKKWKDEGGGASVKFKISVNTGKRNGLSEKEQYDDRALRLNPEVIIKNDDIMEETVKVKMTTVFLGRPVLDTSSYFVYSTETNDLDPIPVKGEKTIKLKGISHDYDNKGSAQYGAKYLGYIVLLHKNGEIISYKSIPEKLRDFDTALLKLKTGKTYSKYMKIIER